VWPAHKARDLFSELDVLTSWQLVSQIKVPERLSCRLAQ